MTLADRFSEFFASLNAGARPYPWQQRLLEEVARTGRWPHIVAPTGAGKSSVVDIHVFLVGEHLNGRVAIRPPRRLILIAPRRVLVDDQHERALAISRRLSDAIASPAPDCVLVEIGRALSGVVTCPTEAEAPTSPLGVWSLRGGQLLDNGWRLDPAACQVICATPQMWGSRLLLRGYGSSRRSRNLEAGLLGHDAVAVIDEAHLHERLLDTASRVGRAHSTDMRLQVIGMSATRQADGALSLDDADLADKGLARRTRAHKPITLVEMADRRSMIDEIVHQARNLADRGTVGVFVNTVPDALDVAAALGSSGSSTVELVCGRLRPADLDRLRARRPGLLSPSGDPRVEFLVATQSLEVGVDLDLPAMVSAIAPAAALAQRAGRLNRSGRWNEAPFVVVSFRDLADAGASETGPYTADDLVEGSRWMSSLGGDICPERVAAADLPVTPQAPLPALNGPELDTLAMTTNEHAADPEVALYIDEPRDGADLAVTLAARRHLDLDPEVVRAALLACPPRAHEEASMRLGKQLDRVLHAVRESGGVVWTIRERTGVREAQQLAHDELPLAGDCLVLPHGSRVCISGVLGVRDGRGVPSLFEDVLHAVRAGEPRDLVVPLAGEAITPTLSEDPLLGGRRARQALASAVADAGHVECAASLRGHRRLSDLEVAWAAPAPDAIGLLIVRQTVRRARQAPLTADDSPVTLAAHQAAVRLRMERIVEAITPTDLGVDPSCLLSAAALHDEGKRHPRFQARMHGPEGVVLAKPMPGSAGDRGDGWRHEQLSAAYAAAQTGDAIVASLVATTHGCGRALFDRDDGQLLDGWAGCGDDVRESARSLFGPNGRYELDRHRLQERLGVHALAFLEALVRCADMQISREGS